MPPDSEDDRATRGETFVAGQRSRVQASSFGRQSPYPPSIQAVGHVEVIEGLVRDRAPKREARAVADDFQVRPDFLLGHRVDDRVNDIALRGRTIVVVRSL